MVQDILKAIDALKTTAFGRCRQRIEVAIWKARELREAGRPWKRRTNTDPANRNVVVRPS